MIPRFIREIPLFVLKCIVSNKYLYIYIYIVLYGQKPICISFISHMSFYLNVVQQVASVYQCFHRFLISNGWFQGFVWSKIIHRIKKFSNVQIFVFAFGQVCLSITVRIDFFSVPLPSDDNRFRFVWCKIRNSIITME